MSQDFVPNTENSSKVTIIIDDDFPGKNRVKPEWYEKNVKEYFESMNEGCSIIDGIIFIPKQNEQDSRSYEEIFRMYCNDQDLPLWLGISIQ